MTTIWIDSSKRAAGRDEDFEFNTGETDLQGSARLGVFKIRAAARGTGHSCPRAPGAYTGVRLAAWISSNSASATYGESTNEITVAHDGMVNLRGPGTLRYLRFELMDYGGNVVNPHGSSVSFCI